MIIEDITVKRKEEETKNEKRKGGKIEKKERPELQFGQKVDVVMKMAVLSRSNTKVLKP